MGILVVLGIIAVLLLALAIPLLRFNRKRLRIMRRASAATDEQLERIYRAIGRASTEPPTCAVLARTNRKCDAAARVPVPHYAELWSGRTIVIAAGDEVSFAITDDVVTEPMLAGGVYRLLSVPRHRTKTGKTRNQFSPTGYLTGNPELLETLTDVDPGYPAELLAYLLSAGRDSFEFDPMFQVRIGGSAAWAQGPVFSVCDQCKKRMHLALQLPGSLLPGKPKPAATYYLFGCPQHPAEMRTVVQYD